VVGTGGTGTGGTSTGGVVGTGGTGGGSNGAGGAAQLQSRGQYLVTILGCTGCHGNDLSGKSCFLGSTSGPDCLSSANLTNDATGLATYTDQQIKDAFTKGTDPDQAGKYLFSTMPYYQFANLTDADASAIVAYLRSVPDVSHTLTNAGMYATQPSAPDWLAADPSSLPNPATGSPSGATNGKYLATLLCVTCHTVNASGTPMHIDATKAFQGGKSSTGSTTVSTSNLTPDATGIMGWSAADVLTAIKLGTTPTSATICNMRALPSITDSDATDIGSYLTHIPAVANTISPKCPGL
jgi:mono/diheme cytochrome c family protein